MRKLVTAAIAAALALVVVGPALAHDTSWAIGLRASDTAGTKATRSLSAAYGTAPSLGNAVLSGPIASRIELYSTSPDGHSRWQKYERGDQPVSSTMVWDLVLDVGADVEIAQVKLWAWNLDTDSSYDLDDNPGFKVCLYRGNSLEYEFKPELNGKSDEPQWTKTYDVPASRTITDFRLVREPLPELPAGALALLASPVCLALRRRR